MEADESAHVELASVSRDEEPQEMTPTKKIGTTADFVNETIVTFEIDGGEFSYKPTTTDDENTWLPYYMVQGEDGKHVQDITELSKCKIINLKSVPWDRETIQEITGLNKDWPEMDKDERWSLIGKLDPKRFNKIILAMDKVDNPYDEEKKI